MIDLTPPERVIRRILLDRAGSAPTDPLGACLTYSELGLAFDPQGNFHHRWPMSVAPFRGLGEALGHVSMYEDDHGRPLLSCLVVQDGARHPGEGFATLARHLNFDVDDEFKFWGREVARTVDLWSDSDPTRIVDAALERIVRDLVAIKRMLRP